MDATIRDVLQRCVFYLKYAVLEQDQTPEYHRLLKDAEALLEGKPVERVAGECQRGSGV